MACELINQLLSGAKRWALASSNSATVLLLWQSYPGKSPLMRIVIIQADDWNRELIVAPSSD